MDCSPQPPSSSSLCGLSVEVDHFFKDLFPRCKAGRERAERRMWAPQMDVLETRNAFRLRFDLPGVDRNDVKIHVEEDWLTICGERGKNVWTDAKNTLRSEKPAGQFYRSVALPAIVEQDLARASFERGILLVDLPKGPEGKERSGTIN